MEPNGLHEDTRAVISSVQVMEIAFSIDRDGLVQDTHAAMYKASRASEHAIDRLDRPGGAAERRTIKKIRP